MNLVSRTAIVAIVACAIAVGLVACGSSPTNPGPVTPPPANQPPVIESITAARERIEVDEEVALMASVRDAETPIEQLIFEWAADGGTFAGQGPSVSWRPAADAATPGDFVIRLTVREMYGTAPPGGPRPEHRVTANSSAIRVHNSQRELGDLAMRFLSDFANASVSADACVREFSDSCRGKEQERSDIEDNRRYYEIVSSSLRLREVTVAGDRLTGAMRANCGFTSRIKECHAGIPNCSVGGIESVEGDCLLTAVYEQNRWWLCSSDFAGVRLGVMRRVFRSSR